MGGEGYSPRAAVASRRLPRQRHEPHGAHFGAPAEGAPFIQAR